MQTCKNNESTNVNGFLNNVKELLNPDLFIFFTVLLGCEKLYHPVYCGVGHA
jgi:hypothetical protein